MSNIIHAAYTKRAKLPAKIRREIETLRGMLAEEVAGSRDLTAIQIILIDRICFKYGTCRCIERYVKEVGLVDRQKGELHHTLGKNYLAWSNSLRLDLRELGSSHRPEDLLEVDWTEPAEGEEKK